MAATGTARRTAIDSPVVMEPATSVRRLVPVADLGEFITPVRDLDVVAHMGVARVDPAAWSLGIDGMVERPLVLDYDELLRQPARDVTAVLEGFGNPLEPDAPTRRAGNIRWRGASLARLLVHAGVNPEATTVWLEGLDSGRFANTYVDRYIKDIPLTRALQPDVLIAYAMNDEPLTHEHGFPARVFVPGYFGTNAVKWLSRITVAATRYQGLFTTRLYNRSIGSARARRAEPARELDVQSVIVTPSDGVRLAPGWQRIGGWAWSAWPVTRVDVSSNGGETWREAALEPRGPDSSWQRFTLDWQAAPGSTIESRARDQQGRTQPLEGRNSVHAVSVTVE